MKLPSTSANSRIAAIAAACAVLAVAIFFVGRSTVSSKTDTRAAQAIAEANALQDAVPVGNVFAALSAQANLNTLRSQGVTLPLKDEKIVSLVKQTYGTVATQKYNKLIDTKEGMGTMQLNEVIAQINEAQAKSENPSRYSPEFLTKASAKNLVAQAVSYNHGAIPRAEQHTAAQIAAMKYAGRKAGIKTRYASSRHLFRGSTTRTVASAGRTSKSKSTMPHATRPQ